MIGIFPRADARGFTLSPFSMAGRGAKRFCDFPLFRRFHFLHARQFKRDSHESDQPFALFAETLASFAVKKNLTAKGAKSIAKVAKEIREVFFPWMVRNFENFSNRLGQMVGIFPRADARGFMLSPFSMAGSGAKRFCDFPLFRRFHFFHARHFKTHFKRDTHESGQPFALFAETLASFAVKKNLTAKGAKSIAKVAKEI